MYKILQRTKDLAEQNNLLVYPSENLKYKLEVHDANNGLFLGYIGANNMLDYPHYLLLEKKRLVSKGYADKRRELYLKRHSKDIHSGKGKLSKILLWS